MASQRKTVDEFQIHQLINGQWEEVTAADTWKEAKSLLKDYRTNQPEYPVKMLTKRVPLTMTVE